MTMVCTPLFQLRLSEKNVRKTHSDADIEEMKTSLMHHGLQQNLVTVLAERIGDADYAVIAGGRRLQALQELKDEGKSVPNIKNWQIPCRVVDAENATELSLVENTIRTAMHPADQFEAWRDLLEQGKSAAAIALRFGVSEQLVRQRMKLGKVAPELMQAFRADDLTLEMLMAFTITDDHARQLDVWHKVKDGWYNPYQIRTMLTDGAIRSTSKLAKFVGEEAYEQAGGVITRDLFEDSCYFENAALLEALARKKLEAAAELYKSKGWANISVQLDEDRSQFSGCSWLQPEYINAPADKLEAFETMRERMEALRNGSYDDEEADEEVLEAEFAQLEKDMPVLEAELKPYLGYPEAVMEQAILSLSINYNGTIAGTVFQQQEDTQVPAGDIGEDTGSLTVHASSASTLSYGKQNSDMSISLQHDLSVYRTQMVQAAIGENFEAAFDMMTFSLCERVLIGEIRQDRYASNRAPIDVTLARYADKTAQDDAYFTTSGQKRQQQFNALAVEWMQLNDEAGRYNAFCALPLLEKQKLFSYCTSIGISSGMYYGKSHPALDISAGRLGVVAHKLWRPGETTFFKRLKKPQLLLLVDKLLGESWMAKVREQTKSQLATWLGRVFEGNPSATSGMDAITLERISKWMPEQMRFASNSDDAVSEYETPFSEVESGEQPDDDTNALPDWLLQTEQEAT